MDGEIAFIKEEVNLLFERFFLFSLDWKLFAALLEFKFVISPGGND